MRYTFLLLSLVFAFPAIAQDKILVDEHYGKVDHPDSAAYYFLVSEQVQEDTFKHYTFYYPDGNLRSTRRKNKDGRWEGPYQEFYKNGQIEEEGIFNDSGFVMGEHRKWNETGDLVLVRNFKENHQPEIEFFRDSTGHIAVENGDGDFYELDEKGQLKAYGAVEKGLKSGEWKGLHSDGTPKYQETYAKGELIKGVSFTDSGEIIYKAISVPSQPEGGYQAFYQFIAQNMRYPGEARKKNIQGKVFIQFTINEKGELTNPYVIKGVHSSIDNEALRVIKLHSGWSVPLQRGIPDKQRIIVPIVFQLG